MSSCSSVKIGNLSSGCQSAKLPNRQEISHYTLLHCLLTLTAEIILKLWCQSFFESTHKGDLVTVLPLQPPHNKSKCDKKRNHVSSYFSTLVPFTETSSCLEGRKPTYKLKNGRQYSVRFVVIGLKHAKPPVWSSRFLGYQVHLKYLGGDAILFLVLVSLVIRVSTLHEVQQVTLWYQCK